MAFLSSVIRIWNFQNRNNRFTPCIKRIFPTFFALKCKNQVLCASRDSFILNKAIQFKNYVPKAYIIPIYIHYSDPSQITVTDNIEKPAKIPLRYVGLAQQNGAVIISQSFYFSFCHTLSYFQRLLSQVLLRSNLLVFWHRILAALFCFVYSMVLFSTLSPLFFYYFQVTLQFFRFLFTY